MSEESSHEAPDLTRQVSKSAPQGGSAKKVKSAQTDNPMFGQNTPPGSPEKLLKGPVLSNWLDIKFNTEAGKSKLFELLRFEEGHEDDEGDAKELLEFLNSQRLRNFGQVGSVGEDQVKLYLTAFVRVSAELKLTPATWTNFTILRTAIQESRKPPKPVDDINVFKASLGSVVNDWWNEVGCELKPDDIKLADFKLPNELATLAVGKIPIKLLPGTEKPRPSLLLSNLPTNGLTEWQLALNKSTESGCTAVFGVSGIGKTRQMFEILSNKYGHYFSAAEGKEGSSVRSADFVALISEINRAIPRLEPEGHVRLGFVADRVDIVVATRTYLLQFLLEYWNITPWQWLLIQLYPKEFLGGCDLLDKLYQKVSNVRYYPMLLREYLKVEGEQRGGDDLIIVVDEAQTLQGKLASHFPSESQKPKKEPAKPAAAEPAAAEPAAAKPAAAEPAAAEPAADEPTAAKPAAAKPAADDDELMIRDALSAVVKAFNGLSQGTPTHGAVFAGTGFRMSHALDTIISGVMKSREVYELETLPLQPLDFGGVKAYLASFFNVETLNEKVLDHICKWLVGRPRWSAAFLERLILFCSLNVLDLNTEIGLLGNEFPSIIDPKQWKTMLSESPVSGTVFVAFYEYLRVNVSPSYKSERLSEYIQTARSVMRNFQKKYSDQAISKAIFKELRMAVFKYACYGKPAQIPRHLNQKETLNIENLIENGLCLFVDHSKTTESISVVQLAEPIIVEAALHFFNMLSLATDYYLMTKNNNENDAQGKILEYCCFPLLRSVFHGRDAESLAYGWRLGRSCHGVLIANNSEPDDVKSYVDDASSAMFDGEVPPLSLTDKYFGCDLLGPVYKKQANNLHVARKFLLCQVKLRNETADQSLLEQSFLTTTPELIWTTLRGRSDQRRIKKRKTMYEEVLKKLRMSSGKGVFQVLVAMVQKEGSIAALGGGYFLQQKARWYKTGNVLDNHCKDVVNMNTDIHDICVDLFLENLKPYLQQDYDAPNNEVSKLWEKAIYP